MSEKNLEIATRAIKAALARPEPDYSTMNELFSADHVLIPIGVASGIENEAQGAKGFEAWRQDVNEFLSAELELRGAVDVGPDKVLAVSLARFEGRASGAAADQRIWSILTVRDGRVIRTESFSEPLGALRAAAAPTE